MVQFLIYDLKVAALIAVCYLFYRLLMERETLHRLNRLVLMASLVLSLVLPLCVITLHQTVLVEASGGDAPSAAPPAAAAPATDWPQQLLAATLLVGIALRLIIIGRNYGVLRRLIATCEQHPQKDGTIVAVCPEPVASFTWMRTIVMSRQDHEAGTAPLVIAHEREHVRRHHSRDVMLVELITALQWFNPVVWLLRQDLRLLHEYEADAAVLSRGFSESQYIQLLMQKATGVQACALACGIGNSQTKKRIVMMLKKKSPRGAALKALFLAPIAVASLALTAQTVIDYQTAPTPVGAELHEVTVTAYMPDSVPQREPVFDVCEVMPEYPGGSMEMMKFFYEKLQYPKECSDSGVQGRVIASFVVEKDGSVTSATVTHSVHPLLDREALRVVSLMPRWKPGRQKNEPVRVKYTVPVTFRLN